MTDKSFKYFSFLSTYTPAEQVSLSLNHLLQLFANLGWGWPGRAGQSVIPGPSCSV